MKNFSIILRTLSPEVLIKKLIRKAGLFISNNYKKIKYQYISTYRAFNLQIFNSDFINSANNLKSILEIEKYQNGNKELIEKLSAKYLNHQFKLLGSDWMDIRFDDEDGENLTMEIEFEENRKIPLLASEFPPLQRGIKGDLPSTRSYIDVGAKINKANQKISSEIKKFLPKDYKYIDWQRDFRSGFRWNESKLSIENKYGNKPGVDVKHPWELGRMQHLINFYYLWKISNDDKFANEFQNQILDFIANNPPGFGIQWKIAMDPGIRAVNWIIVYSLFKSDGYIFDEKFEKYFNESIFNHYYFIKNNLEWGSGIRGNHYFANITSILIVLLFAQNDDLIKDFHYFLNELKNEIFYQFLDDGGNFEISLPYHYFVTEILVVTMYFLINSNWQKNEIEKFIVQISNKISKIFNFTISNLNNCRIQNYGDNDSGYFFRLFHPFISKNENIEFNLNDYYELFEMINFIAGKLNLNIQHLNNFPHFGIYNFKNDIYSLNFYNSKFSKKTRGAHQHNDVLSFTLQIGDNDFIIDSGTFNYTAFPDMRNKFRSIEMHNVLQLDNYEQREIPFGRNDLLFWLIDRGESQIDEVKENYIKGSHNFFDCYYSRDIKFDDNIILFTETCRSDKIKILRNILSPDVSIIDTSDSSITTFIANKKIKFTFEDCKIEIKEIEESPNYGELVKTKLILTSSANEIINWKIEILNEIN